jgi:signal transduction histidine kinase
MSIRWRLALTSAGLTFAILLLFAIVIGAFMANRLSSDFDNDLRATSADLQQRVPVRASPLGAPVLARDEVLDVMLDVAATGDAVLRVVGADGEVLAGSEGSAELGPPRDGVRESGEYRIVSRPLSAGSLEPVAFLQYGKRTDSLEATLGRVKLFLGLGVLAGTALALLAGLAVARRAMRPVADLTHAAKDVARTRDPAVALPQPRADDEVADLARTLEEMLRALDAARRETESTLEREREFVADASHELRTPLTSVLANLELLEADLRGEDAEIAGSALRSTQRMRRLVADLLFLARADTGRRPGREPADLGAIVREAAGETAPLAGEHRIAVEAPSGVVVRGSADDLHRLALNLLQNAVVHTPTGSAVKAVVRREGGPEGADGPGSAVLEVSDDGPGVPPEVRDRVFERFARGAGDGRGPAGPGGRGSGLGLPIVRAVAEAHGGSVALDDAEGGGARFTVRLPAAAALRPRPRPAARAAGA